VAVISVTIKGAEDNKIFPAGGNCNVATPEPLPPGHPLWSLPNPLMTPHDSTSSDLMLPRLSILARENPCDDMAGEP